MNKDLQSWFPGKLYTSVPYFFIVGMLFLLPCRAWSQKKQLTPSGKIVKIAFIDHSRLRKEFKEFVAGKEKLAKENIAEKKSWEQALQLLDEQTKEQLKQDSLSGGKKYEQIISQSTSKRSEIMNNYQLNQKKRNQERIILTQVYEGRIISAMEVVIAEGGFTEVKSLVKDSSGQRTIDITDILLKKLN